MSPRVCYVPRYDGPDMEMLSVHSLDDVASLPLTSWNIPQPASGEGRENSLTSGQGLDLILVPGLGFSEVTPTISTVITGVYKYMFYL